jgi:hypothetical protein
MAAAMRAGQLRHSIVAQANGEARHVVAGVYEAATSGGGHSGVQILLFIGGSLSGSSANAFIGSFVGQLPGAFDTGPGALGGRAACVPGGAGRPAECAWADNDTFGVLASPTLSAAGLARELRQMRPLVEHAVR